MEGSLSNHQLCVWSAHVEAREDTVAPLSTQSTNDGLEEIEGKTVKNAEQPT